MVETQGEIRAKEASLLAILYPSAQHLLATTGFSGAGFLYISTHIEPKAFNYLSYPHIEYTEELFIQLQVANEKTSGQK